MLLVERERAMGQLEDMLAKTNTKKSITAMIRGSTAMGKTSLLHAFERRAAATGTTVLSVKCSPDEQELPYSSLRRLFERSKSPMPYGEEASADSGYVLTEKARWTFRTVSELAEHGPLLLSIDDIQHADAFSLRCLQHLAHQSSRGSLMIVFTWDQPVDQKTHPLLEELVYHPALRSIQLSPLSQRGVAEMVTRQLGHPDADGLAELYHSLAGGNPLLVNEMLNDPKGETFRKAVLACTRRTGPLALRTARGLALLGESANMHLLSRLNGASTLMTRHIVRRLTDIGVLDDLHFRHPAAESAILDDIPRDEEVELRYRAAQLLHQEGEPSETIARQLLAVGPSHHDWVLPILQDAAQHALAHNQVTLSLDYLQLAIDCCSDRIRQQVVRAQMAEIEWLRRPTSAHPRLRSLKEPILAGEVGSGRGLAIAGLMLWNLRFDDALEIIEHFDDGTEVRQSATAADSLSVRLLISSTYPGLSSRLGTPRASIPHHSQITAPATYSQALHANHVLWKVLTQQADRHTIAQAEQVLQDGSFRLTSCEVIGRAILSLVYADMITVASAWCSRFLDRPGSHDVSAWRGVIGSISALVSFREGHLDAAVQEAETALAHISGAEWNESSVLALSTLAEAHTAIGSHDVAAELFARSAPSALFETRAGLHYLHARGRHHLATGRARMALADFTACGERMIRWNIDTPALAPWRAGAAEAWLSLGERKRAAELIEAQPSGRSLDLVRTKGVNLRCLAATHGIQQRPPILEKALQVLQQSGDRYQTAQVLADLSETYRSLGDKAKARMAARRARRIAESCHTDKLHRALVPVYLPLSKPDQVYDTSHNGDKFAKLSDSERRVAVLAAQGYTNREIANKLHVTISTIEQHLTRVYRKMHIRNREELPAEFHIGAAHIV